MKSIAKLYAQVRFCAILAGSCIEAQEIVQPDSTVIVNAKVADGTGAALRKVSVRKKGDRIMTVGTFTPRSGERVLDAEGLALAPGFIDMQNNSDGRLAEEPLAVSQVAQGITTAILCLDGGSPWPVSIWLDGRRRSPASWNIAFLVEHGTLRKQVMQTDYKRAANVAEVEQMAQFVEQAMREGAIGLSSGVEYDIASYSDTRELVAVAAAARHRGST